MKAKIKRICTIAITVTLILGILSSAFGITILAIGGTPSNATQNVDPDTGLPTVGIKDEKQPTETVDPTKDYDHLPDEAELKDEVEILTDAESDVFNNSITSIHTQDYYGKENLCITIAGDLPEDLTYGDVFYLQGDQSTPFGEDRIFKLESYSSSYSDQTTTLRVSEPYFEDVFDSFEYSSADALTQANFVKGYYANGVNAHFGDIDKELLNVDAKSSSTPEVVTLANKAEPEISNTANELSTKGDDLIVDIEFDLKKQKDDDDEEDHFVNVDTNFNITGSFGIRDLVAYMVFDMPSATEINELYLGISGETFNNISVNAGIDASANMKATEKDLKILTLEGLNDKLLPIAVFEFKGTTPVYITNSAFKNGKEKITPAFYIILYSDWEGKISVQFTGKIDYSNQFNNGLRVFKNGEPHLAFEDYPYAKAYDTGLKKDLVTWEVGLTINANTDITVFGGSLLFYILGINVGEISAARFGIEAECNLEIKANSLEGIKFCESDDTYYYIRGYLKIIEAKVKLKADGKSFLKRLSIDVNFEFALLDFTLFEKGDMPEKYKPKLPISSKQRPNEFQSAISLVFDTSGSMGDRIDSGQDKLTAAKEAASTIVTTSKDWSEKYDANYGIGVVRFADSAETVALPHIDYKFIDDCIATLAYGGGTNIYSGIDAGISQLENTNTNNKIIILMTDGQDSYRQSTLDSAQKAADAGIKIYTVGFGDGADEELLRQIAEITDGEYRFADTQNIMSIIGSFMYAQQSSNADVLGDIEATVGEGEKSDKLAFNVEKTGGDLLVTTVWPGSFLDTILIDPNGRIVDENYPDAITDESTIPSTITVNNPLPGEWEMYVVGVETSYEQEPFYSIVSYKENSNDAIAVNEKMTTLEVIAAYALPIGIVMTLVSAMLLIALRDTDNNKEKSSKNKSA